MIEQSEVLEIAGELGLRPDVVEKDYVLGWLLAGISSHSVLGGSWVFKGGTCLKKCYFETYRFSEDLDFTIEDAAQLDEAFLAKAFGEVADWVYERSGVELPNRRFQTYENPRGGLNCEGRIYYRGPRRTGGDLPRVKLDLTADETVVRAPVIRPVAHPYSDAPAEGIAIRCYAFEEMFAEKVRALAERARPRDLYDVVNLFRHDEFRPSAADVMAVLREKSTFKKIAVPVLATVEVRREELAADWQTMLGHQLRALPPVEVFWAVLGEFFEWLEGRVSLAVQGSVPAAAEESVVREPVRALGIGGRQAGALEAIRFAAANRLCVDLAYGGSVRRIEPYSLRRTRAGDLVLHTIRADSGEHRSYRMDRIESASPTSQAFTPRYLIELTPTGPLPVQPSSARVASSPVFRSPTPSRRRSTSPGGPRYVYECGVCGKKFYRKKQGSRLRPHKTKDGWRCGGRVGIFLGFR